MESIFAMEDAYKSKLYTHWKLTRTWFMRTSSSLMVSSRTQHSSWHRSADKSSELIRPPSTISLALLSARESQKRRRLSKWPLMIVVPALSLATRSLQEEPANIVRMPAPYHTVCSAAYSCSVQSNYSCSVQSNLFLVALKEEYLA